MCRYAYGHMDQHCKTSLIEIYSDRVSNLSYLWSILSIVYRVLAYM